MVRPSHILKISYLTVINFCTSKFTYVILPISWPLRHVTLFLSVIMSSSMNPLLTCMVIFHLNHAIINNCVSISDLSFSFSISLLLELLLNLYHSVVLGFPHLPDLQVLCCFRVQCPLFYLHSLFDILVSRFYLRARWNSTER